MLAPLLIAATLAPPTLTAHPRGEAPIIIDGRLTEAPWLQAAKGAHFRERTPTPGATPSVPSTVQVLYDRDAIYVGVRMALLPGETPKAFELRRDSGRIWAFDAVTVKIDPRRDQRTTLGFAVNPAGAQIDLIALDNGRVFRVEHDSVWEVATHVGPDAWTAEYRIPASALGVRATEGEQLMGLNVSRDHAARVATDDWALMPPGFGPVSALHYGELRGVQGMGAGRPFALIPYGLAAMEGGDFRGGLGGEARLQIGGSGWAEMSVRTDFAEVDLDDALINLDRFPLFFPERRPFFLNGLDVFEFGESGWTQLFFSRRIGLDSDGNQVPIHTGAKLFQRDGRVRGGVLSVITGAHDDRAAALWNVARGRVEVGDGHVGAILTHRTDVPTLGEGETDVGHLGLGLDTQLRLLDTRLQIEGSGVLSANSGKDSATDTPSTLTLGGGSVLKVQWRGRNFRPRVRTFRADETYDPKMGFLRRGNAWTTDAGLEYVWLNPADGMRAISAELSPFVILDADATDRQGLGGVASLAFAWNSGWSIRGGFGWDEDTVADDFELADRATIPAGTYDGLEYEVVVNSPSARTPDFSFGVGQDLGYFGGQRTGGRLISSWYLGSWVRLAGDVRLDRIDVPDTEAFFTTAFNGQVSVTPSPTVAIDTVGQYVSVSERISALVRLRWRWAPGSDIFVVYREAHRADEPVDRRATLKATWWIDGLL
jgi:hypothetical protein